jgi:hypothetical protein
LIPFSHIFTLPLNERFTFALKTTLHKDGTPDTGEYEQASLLLFDLSDSPASVLYSRGDCSLQAKFDSHADDFHYVMCGKIFRRRKEAGNLFVYMSCGGLLCCLNTTAGNSASLDDDIFRFE